MTAAARVVVAGALLIVAALAVTPIGETDFWWHLRTGQWIWENHRIPREDFYSYTAAGTPWVDHEWLFQAALWPVYRLGGINAVIFGKILAVVGATVLLALAFTPRVPLAWLAVWTCAGALVGCPRFTARPEALALLFAGALWFLLERRRWPWLIPVIVCLWANVHSSFPLGLVLVAAYGLTHGRRGVLLMAISAAACLVNPYGVRLLTEMFRHFELTAFIDEWQPTFPAVRSASGWRVGLFWMLELAGAVAVVNALRQRRWARAIVLAGLIGLSWRAIRFAMLFAVLAAPVIAAELWELLARVGAPFRARSAGPVAPGRALLQVEGLNRRASIAWLMIALEAVVLWSVVTNRLYVMEHLPQRFGGGVAEDQLPLRAARALNKLPVTGPLFNTYGAGGAVIWECWPRWKVFTDGRLVVYDERVLRSDLEARGSAERWYELEARYGFAAALVEIERGGILTSLLDADPRWDLAYRDQVIAIYVQYKVK